jgi:hypothetical protein
VGRTIKGDNEMPFSEELKTKTYDETKKRTSAQYVKFSEDYRVVLRILDTNARTIWKHWVAEANGGRGMMANCPNTATNRICPIDKQLDQLANDDPRKIERKAKRRFTVNVLDRTPVTVCPACNAVTPGKTCQSCHTDLKKAEFVPLNKVKILEGGPELFNKTLNTVEKIQFEDFGVDITGYDINFTTTGKLRDRKIAALPKEPEELPEGALDDPETGEQQSVYDLDLLSEPTSVEEIELMMNGATLEEILAVRG